MNFEETKEQFHKLFDTLTPEQREELFSRYEEGEVDEPRFTEATPLLAHELLDRSALIGENYYNWFPEDHVKIIAQHIGGEEGQELIDLWDRLADDLGKVYSLFSMAEFDNDGNTKEGDS